MNGFWRAWLTVWCFGVGAFGLVLISAGLPGNEAFADWLFASFGRAPSTVEAPLQFATALMGAVTLGWALTLSVAFRAAALLPPEAQSRFWRGILLGMVIWYGVDSALSIATGFPLNAVSNSVVMTALLVPLWFGGALRAQRLSTAS